ncbi:hypothetical protein [Pseudomonas mandelii]|uniref:hypothetical protein n=1 Tax=Pseudomonas mandelii TaxID=75612 RepID=UPI00209FEAA6|nr:hypothetical protein [Pseudomonas mandelii]MCO8313188.1 hypothetical protein [Pseudomonas mandelii]
MTTKEHGADKKVQLKTTDLTDSGVAHILFLRDQQARFFASNNVSASLRHCSMYTDAGSLITQYGRTLFPQDDPYILDLPGAPHNIDYRDEDGVYFIRPLSGQIIIQSEHAGAPDTYTHKLTFLNVRFETEGIEVTINGTGIATFIFN